MAEYINKEQFLASMGLTGDETKYGNRDAEHQHRSYSTYMSYEIMDCVDDSIVEEELVPVVHGQWMEVPYVYIGLKRYECSNCYSDVFWNDRIQHHKDKYCPNCGARMDGE